MPSDLKESKWRPGSGRHSKIPASSTSSSCGTQDRSPRRTQSGRPATVMEPWGSRYIATRLLGVNSGGCREGHSEPCDRLRSTEKTPEVGEGSRKPPSGLGQEIQAGLWPVKLQVERLARNLAMVPRETFWAGPYPPASQPCHRKILAARCRSSGEVTAEAANLLAYWCLT